MERTSTEAHVRRRQWDMSGADLPDPAPMYPIGFMAPLEPGRKGRPPVFLDVSHLQCLMTQLGLSVREVQRLVVVWDPQMQRWLKPSVSTLLRKLKAHRSGEAEESGTRERGG